MRIAVVGTGAAGLAAAFDLSRVGHPVVCFEASDQVGGLAGGFTVHLTGFFGERALALD